MFQIVNVYKQPKFRDTEALSYGAVVVVDVLRAATTIVYALQAGAKCVVPCREIDEARRIAARFAPHEVILGGERGGLPIEGFDLGNSPEEYKPDRVRGKTVVFTTTNGTQALLHARKAKKILLGAFVNASAVAEKLAGLETVHILCAGTEGEPSDDDVLFAGMLAEKLQRKGGGQCNLNDQAVAAHELWRHTLEIARATAAQPLKGEPLAKILRHTLGGRNLVSLGLDRDILAAAQIDRYHIVPEFNLETSRIQVIK
jgi:2-phosphosulfolactate phosphatase